MKLSAALIVLLASTPSVSAFSLIHGEGKCRAFELPSKSTSLFGILDEVNSDAFDLLGGSTSSNSDENDVSKEMETAYETFLAQLVFSTNDPRVDIVENFELVTDDKWLTWLTNKIESSVDAEEKIALRDLNDMIIDVQRKIEVNQLAEQRKAEEAEKAEIARLAAAEVEAEKGRQMSNTDVLRKAGSLGLGGSETAQISEENTTKKKSFIEEELTPEIRLSYDEMCRKVLPPYKVGESAASIVFSYYDQFDAQFIKVLTERAQNGDNDSKSVLDALSIEQSKRMEAATDNIKAVISLGDPMRMEGAIIKMAREGKIDESFLLLLEANANMALQAGAKGPAEVMKKLSKRAMEEKDKQSSSKEVKLIRKLLRTDDPAEREEILVDAFTPKEQFIVPGTQSNAQKAMDGEAPEEEKPMPDVPPPDFINACKAVLLNFGNLSSDDDRGDLATRIKQFAAEAEVVATRIYGQGMTAREQQDRMWKDQTTSIFDLETLEIEAERNGETAPWANPDNDDILPGFDKDGRMKIGGG